MNIETAQPQNCLNWKNVIFHFKHYVEATLCVYYPLGKWTRQGRLLILVTWKSCVIGILTLVRVLYVMNTFFQRRDLHRTS